jgi:cell division protein FtsQ
MTRKQAKRRRQDKARRFRLPSLPWRKLAVLSLALTAIATSYYISTELLDRPITEITIEGPFQRVSALQIEEAISGELANGFLSADLNVIRDLLLALPWIDAANVVRRWPGNLDIRVTEQIPAASWGERGLLNTRGELFVTDARHVPPELPRLSGPDGQYSIVARRYLDLRDGLIATGQDVRRVHVDARGAWEMTLANGIDIRFGRRDVGDRIQLFLDVVAAIVSSREQEIAFVDMRYGNGFTIGWKRGARSPVLEIAGDEPGMVAGIIE